MRLSQFRNHKWNYNALAFAFPFVGMLVLMLIGGYSPFGKYAMIYSDMFHQYFPFFKAFRNALLSGDSLLYSWDIGMGVDYLGLFSYYLASPLNLLSILVPEQWLLGYFSLLMPIKLGLASLFFGVFLKKTFGKQDLSTVLFGSFYALCAWALGYQWNVMWLDTFAVLPLVIVGMVSLLKENRFVLYTLTLFFSIYANYYIGLFTCIFVLLVFICYQICRWQNWSTFIKDLCRIALFSVLAIGMTAILSLPTLSALQTTQSSINKFPEGFRLNMTAEDNWLGLIKTMAKVAGNTNGGITPTYKEGLPNLYCGILTTILATLYLFCKQVRKRDKFCAVGLLLFFNVSFIVSQLDYIWHGFHFTNMIPYRFSFLYSFVLLYMAYSAWIHRKSFHLWQVILSAMLAIGILFCYEDLTDWVFWAYNGVLLLLYLTTLVYYYNFRPFAEDEDIHAYKQARSARRSLCSMSLIAIMAIELVLNLINFGATFPVVNVTNYPKGKHSTEDTIAYMNSLEANTPFYRAEVTHAQTLNDGALNSYHGISAFTSSANVKVTEFMKALGYGAKNSYNRYCFEESSPVANLFLGLKYMIERDGKIENNPYFDDIYTNGDVHLLENNAYLPLGFLANSQLLNVDFSVEGNPFSFQNELMQQATGITEDVWSPMPGTMLAIQANGPQITPQPTTGYCAYTTDEQTDGTIIYSYTANQTGLMCVNLELSKRNSFSFRLNGNDLYSETYTIPQMLSICEVKPGDMVEIELKCKKNEKGTIKIISAILNEPVFRKGYDILSASVLELTDFSNTQVTGTIDCQREGVLYTSIPQNGNWYAEIDGKTAEIVIIGNAMVGLLLPKGQHTIRFIYKNEAFNLGWKISLTCALIFLGIYLSVYKPTFRRKKGKYER